MVGTKASFLPAEKSPRRNASRAAGSTIVWIVMFTLAWLRDACGMETLATALLAIGPILGRRSSGKVTSRDTLPLPSPCRLITNLFRHRITCRYYVPAWFDSVQRAGSLASPEQHCIPQAKAGSRARGHDRIRYSFFAFSPTWSVACAAAGISFGAPVWKINLRMRPFAPSEPRLRPL